MGYFTIATIFGNTAIFDDATLFGFDSLTVFYSLILFDDALTLGSVDHSNRTAPIGDLLGPLPPLPPRTSSVILTVELISTVSGSSCITTTVIEMCQVPLQPCITSDVCISYIATATPPPAPPPPSSTTSTSQPLPTSQVYITLSSDTKCLAVIEQIPLNEIGQCHTPVDASGKPITFKCFGVTSVSPAAANTASLSAFKGPGCFSQDNKQRINYPSLMTIQYKDEKPLTMGSLSLGAI
ncbi:hypothetical protein VTL71DRAFT_7223 [Oculimacula yallundae]|uniref:Uncharacterized protein n=1 Tax=Oculimacula yallundae TaxID=86028 RepID=A0ABR4BW44_9HELO